MNDLLRELVDKQALTDVVNLYVITSDRYDAEGYGALWMADGVFTFPGGWPEPLIGRDAIVDEDFRLMKTYQVVQHVMANPYFTINGDTAEGRTNVIFHGCLDKNAIDQHVSGGGAYSWTFQRTADGWKIKTLYLEQLWASGELGAS